MGRNSPARKTLAPTASAVRADRRKALQQANEPLRSEIQQAERILGEVKGGTIRHYYALGQIVRRVQMNPGGIYGEGNPFTLMERVIPHSARQLRDAGRFACAYTDAELDELCSLRNTDAGFQLSWGHVIYLLGLSTQRQREEFAARAVAQLWDPKALSEAIQKRQAAASEGRQGHGRAHALPATIHMQLRQIREETRKWVAKKREVWDGDAVSVIANVMNAKPAELTAEDLENLEQIQTHLNEMQTEATNLWGEIDRVERHVRQALEAREQEAEANVQAAAEEPAPVAKRQRVIQVDRPTRRAAASAAT